MPNQLQKCQRFAELHRSESAWIIPNPWDAGSARLLQGLGFPALATTSSGFSHTLGRTDGQVTLEEMLAHCTVLCAATEIPISADFENAYCETPAGIRENIHRLASTGVAGFSIEDYSRDRHKLYDFSEAVERVHIAAEAIAELALPLQLTARAENLIRGHDDIDESMRRLKAFEAAGADVLYAPGIRTEEQLRQITSVIEKPFNVLASFMGGMTVAQLGAAGATRVSLGGALSQASIEPLLRAGREMLASGSFAWLDERADGALLERLIVQVD